MSVNRLQQGMDQVETPVYILHVYAICNLLVSKGMAGILSV